MGGGESGAEEEAGLEEGAESSESSPSTPSSLSVELSEGEAAQILRQRLLERFGVEEENGVLFWTEKRTEWGRWTWSPDPRRWTITVFERLAVGATLFVCVLMWIAAAYHFLNAYEYDQRIREIVAAEADDVCARAFRQPWTNCSRPCGGGTMWKWVPSDATRAKGQDCKVKEFTDCNTSPCPPPRSQWQYRACPPNISTWEEMLGINARFQGRIVPAQHYRNLIQCLLCEWTEWSCPVGSRPHCVQLQVGRRRSRPDQTKPEDTAKDQDSEDKPKEAAEDDGVTLCREKRLGTLIWSQWTGGRGPDGKDMNTECLTDKPGGPTVPYRYQLILEEDGINEHSLEKETERFPWEKGNRCPLCSWVEDPNDRKRREGLQMGNRSQVVKNCRVKLGTLVLGEGRIKRCDETISISAFPDKGVLDGEAPKFQWSEWSCPRSVWEPDAVLAGSRKLGLPALTSNPCALDPVRSDAPHWLKYFKSQGKEPPRCPVCNYFPDYTLDPFRLPPEYKDRSDVDREEDGDTYLGRTVKRWLTLRLKTIVRGTGWEDEAKGNCDYWLPSAPLMDCELVALNLGKGPKDQCGDDHCPAEQGKEDCPAYCSKIGDALISEAKRFGGADWQTSKEDNSRWKGRPFWWKPLEMRDSVMTAKAWKGAKENLKRDYLMNDFSGDSEKYIGDSDFLRSLHLKYYRGTEHTRHASHSMEELLFKRNPEMWQGREGVWQISKCHLPEHRYQSVPPAAEARSRPTQEDVAQLLKKRTVSHLHCRYVWTGPYSLDQWIIYDKGSDKGKLNFNRLKHFCEGEAVHMAWNRPTDNGAHCYKPTPYYKNLFGRFYWGGGVDNDYDVSRLFPQLMFRQRMKMESKCGAEDTAKRLTGLDGCVFPFWQYLQSRESDTAHSGKGRPFPLKLKCWEVFAGGDAEDSEDPADFLDVRDQCAGRDDVEGVCGVPQDTLASWQDIDAAYHTNEFGTDVSYQGYQLDRETDEKSAYFDKTFSSLEQWLYRPHLFGHASVGPYSENPGVLPLELWLTDAWELGYDTAVLLSHVLARPSIRRMAQTMDDPELVPWSGGFHNIVWKTRGQGEPPEFALVLGARCSSAAKDRDAQSFRWDDGTFVSPAKDWDIDQWAKTYSQEHVDGKWEGNGAAVYGGWFCGANAYKASWDSQRVCRTPAFHMRRSSAWATNGRDGRCHASDPAHFGKDDVGGHTRGIPITHHVAYPSILNQLAHYDIHTYRAADDKPVLPLWNRATKYNLRVELEAKTGEFNRDDYPDNDKTKRKEKSHYGSWHEDVDFYGQNIAMLEGVTNNMRSYRAREPNWWEPDLNKRRWPEEKSMWDRGFPVRVPFFAFRLHCETGRLCEADKGPMRLLEVQGAALFSNLAEGCRDFNRQAAEHQVPEFAAQHKDVLKRAAFYRSNGICPVFAKSKPRRKWFGCCSPKLPQDHNLQRQIFKHSRLPPRMTVHKKS